ncbi:MAG: hypothetical protein K0U98_08435 [Deltaproteobacteria bacterium]|nr:hypothetical protein [Deltaproteobacteria bacterium]
MTRRSCPSWIRLNIYRTCLGSALLGSALALSMPDPGAAQQILLDDFVQGGGMTLYRDLRDENAYYYLPNQPRLAVDEVGQPAFSFLRWAENTRPAGDPSGSSDAEGGGIVHLQMELGADAEQIQRARNELRRQKPSATLKGPIGYRRGRFALVFTGSQEDVESGTDPLTSAILGIGNAPLLGGRASVNIVLTRQGARVLWQAFQKQSRPPLAVRFFDMEVAGFRGPIGVTIEADLEEVYNHKAFAAGVAHSYFGAEIEAAFTDLRNAGAIRETWVGEDERFEGLVNQTYRALVSRLFEPIPDPADLKRLAGKASAGGGGSLLDRAFRLLEAGQKRSSGTSQVTPKASSSGPGGGSRGGSRASSPAKTASPGKTTPTGQGKGPAKGPGKGPGKDKAKPGAAAAAKASKAEAEGKALLEKAKGLEKKVQSGRRQVAEAEKKLAEATPEKPAKIQQEDIDKAKKRIATYDKEAKTLRTRAKAKQQEAARLRKAASGNPPSKAADAGKAPQSQKPGTQKPETQKPSSQKPGTQAAETPSSAEEEDSSPALAVLASFQMRRRSQQKTLRIELNRHSQDQILDRFDGEVGDVSGCRRCFLQINLDDPLYRQREVAVYVDGLNLEDFGRFVNFVSFELRKRHGEGDLTQQELRIDQKSLAESGNRFSLLYGWKGDGDRSRWLEYEYRVVWSFFGGSRIAEPWRTTRDGAIGLFPPLVIQRLGLSANAEALEAARVRALTVQIFTQPVDGERTEQITLVPGRGEFSGDLEVLLPKDRRVYDYLIEWRLTGGTTVSSGRQSTRSTTLFVDELPTQEGR